MLDSEAIRAAYNKLLKSCRVQRVTRKGPLVQVVLNSDDNHEMVFTISDCGPIAKPEALIVDQIHAWQKSNVLRVASSLLTTVDIKA